MQRHSGLIMNAHDKLGPGREEESVQSKILGEGACEACGSSSRIMRAEGDI